MSDAPEFAGVVRRWGGDAVAVVLAEESSLVRRQLLLALEAHPRVEVAAEAADAEVLVGVLAEVRPHVVVIAGQLPPDGAGAAVMAARRAHPAVRVVVVVDGREQGSLPLPGVSVVALQEAATQLAPTVVALADERRGSEARPPS